MLIDFRIVRYLYVRTSRKSLQCSDVEYCWVFYKSANLNYASIYNLLACLYRCHGLRKGPKLPRGYMHNVVQIQTFHRFLLKKWQRLHRFLLKKVKQRFSRFLLKQWQRLHRFLLKKSQAEVWPLPLNKLAEVWSPPLNKKAQGTSFPFNNQGTSFLFTEGTSLPLYQRTSHPQIQGTSLPLVEDMQVLLAEVQSLPLEKMAGVPPLPLKQMAQGTSFLLERGPVTSFRKL